MRFIVGAFLTVFANMRFIEGFLNNYQICRTRKVLISLDAPRYQYFPYFIEVYRCNGICSTVSPNYQECTAVTWNNITDSVVDLSTQTMRTVTVQNHTSCKCVCVTKAEDCSENELFNKDNCRCDCKYSNQPPSPCPERFSWNPFECKCVCRGPVKFCSAGQEWSHQDCGCVCTRFAVETCKSEKKYLNASTCECQTLAPTKFNPGVTGRRTSEVMDWKRIAWVMLAELIILILLFDLYLCCRYEKGVIHWILGKCRSSSEATTTETDVSRTDANNSASNAAASATSLNHNNSPSMNRSDRYRSRESMV